MQDFSDLDSLLSSAIAHKNDEARLKALRKKTILAPNATQTEREAHEAEVRALEAKVIWTPQAYCAMFTETKCQCGQIHHTFESFFVRLAHKTDRYLTRYAPPTGIEVADLPRETLLHTREVPLCEVCLEASGFPEPTRVICTTEFPTQLVAENLEPQS